MAGTVADLPRLREDLQLTRAGPSYSGAPVWIVHDPAGNKFFRLTYEMFQVFSLWNRSKTAPVLAENLMARYGRELEPTELDAVMRVAETGQLFEEPPSGGWQSLHAIATRKHSIIMSAVHNYLFFKLPLVRPQRFLELTWPLVRPLFSRGFVIFTMLLGLIGLYFVSRQWDGFINSFPYFFTLEGLIVSSLAVTFVKSLHELGHGYMAHHYGCRVPTMGLAFMVMIPLLYTDVTEAWRLKSPRQRIMIDSAGIMVELCLGMICLFLWAFLPDGPVRSAVFVTATVSWVLSLVMNLNPLMRFDGYYILSDLIGVSNLQSRCFTHMRWRLRRFLFGIDEAPPELFPRRLDIILTVYAAAVAIYRVFLYIGIALVVYHFFIKAVGILLFLVEVIFFLLRPLWAELKIWWTMRQSIATSPRAYVSTALFAGLAVACFLPLSSTVMAPAMMEPKNFAHFYPVAAGRITKIAAAPGQAVKAGDLLFEITSPAIAFERRSAETEIALRELRIGRGGADGEDLQQSVVLQRELQSFKAKLRGLADLEEKLVIRAAFDGVMAEVNPKLYQGRWVSRREELGYLATTEGAVSRGYVDGDALPRIASGANAVFVPDDITEAKQDLNLTSIAMSGAAHIDIPALASINGGPIAVQETAERKMTPVQAQYAVSADGGFAPARAHRGMLLIEARPESLAARAWRQVLKVVVRESGA